MESAHQVHYMRILMRCVQQAGAAHIVVFCANEFSVSGARAPIMHMATTERVQRQPKDECFIDIAAQ